MEKEKMVEIINKLLSELEEEDIGISLLTTYAVDEEDLNFFSEEDRKKVIKILEILSEDSKRHKKMLEEVVDGFMEKIYKR